MRTTIEFDPTYALLTAELNPGESIKAEPGAMVAQAGVDMKTSTGGGGILGGVRRMMARESFFINTFTGGPNGGWISLAPPTPGDIKSFDPTPGNDILIQSGSFLAATDTVAIKGEFQGVAAVFSNEGFFFVRASVDQEPGTVFYNAFGAIKEIPVSPGQELVVDTGHLVAFSNDIEYTIGKVGGIRSLVAGGEGLVIKLRGAGTVWIQTRNLQSLADKMVPFLPTRTKQ